MRKKEKMTDAPAPRGKIDWGKSEKSRLVREVLNRESGEKNQARKKDRSRLALWRIS